MASDIERAQELLGQRRYAECAARCEKVLRVRPLHADALEVLGTARLAMGRFPEGIACLHSAAALSPEKTGLLAQLGDALLRTGQALQAAEAFRRAIEQCGPSPQLYYNRGLALQAAQNTTGAIEAYRQCLSLDPGIAEAHNNLGTLLDLSGRFQEAIHCFEQALARRPDYVRALTNLGKVLRQVGRSAEALDVLRKALTLVPDHAPALGNLGAALVDAGQYEDALEGLRRAIQIEPQMAEGHHHVGRALLAQGKRGEALISLRHAVFLKASLVEAQALLGQALLDEGQFAQAIGCLQQATAANPKTADLLVLLGIAQYRGERLQDAADSFAAAVALDHSYSKAFLFRGWALEALEKLPEAVADYERAAALSPDDAETTSSLLSCYTRMCDWSRSDQQLQRLRESPQLLDGINPFVLLSVSDVPSEQLRASRARAHTIVQGRVPFGPSRSYDHERIRVAYLSRDFFSHATSFLVAELFGLHDRSAFEVFGVSYGPDDGSAIRARIVASCDEFLDVRTRSDRQIATTLLDREIDILVDLKGYTAWARTEILALRPAPIQVSYLGYPGTMGAPFIDYLIGDEFLIPAAERPFYFENVVYLPDSYQVNDRHRAVSPTPLKRSDFGLPEEGFVFCCFNNNWKITRPVFDVWMRLLAAVPGSVLWLLEANPWSVENLRAAAQSRGINPERLIFCGRTGSSEHLARHQLADLFLDTLPVNAHTTASDALWTGLPLVTCAGRGFAARVAGSLLHAVNLGELVTSCLEAYEQVSLSLARDPDRLRAIRARLVAGRATLPLFDTPAFCRDLEAAYNGIRLIHRNGEQPRDFRVTRPAS